jgi:hypothetical protein
MFCPMIEKCKGKATKATWQHVQHGNIPLHCCHVALPLRGTETGLYEVTEPKEGQR